MFNVLVRVEGFAAVFVLEQIVAFSPSFLNSFGVEIFSRLMPEDF